MRILLLLTILFAANNSFCQAAGKGCAEKDSTHWATTPLGCLYFNTYKSDSLTANPTLVIVIHGDAPFNKPGYQYRAAKLIAAQNSNTIAVGLLRPGYTDPDNNTSGGIKGLTTGDNYTPEVVNAIADAITGLKKIYHPGKVILAGHSGGSAITADIIGVKPGLVNAAVIVSCPCNVPEWRTYMGGLQPDVAAWKVPVTSISPNTVAGKISKSTRVTVISGKEDDVCPTRLSVDYYNQLNQYGINAKLIQIDGEKHEILLHSDVFAAIKEMITAKE